MVYCGKPSRGCQMCRDRRIKCDEGKPTCFQCQKSRRQCPGYKDDFDLVFRDVSKATATRAKRLTNNKKGNAQVAQIFLQREGSSDDRSDTSISTVSSSMSLSNSLVIPVEQRATHFFLANFCHLPRPGTARGYMDYVYPLIKTEPSNAPLSYAFNAVAMAAMGNRPDAKPLLLSANDHYTRALRHVNMALRDPLTQRADATLAAVLLLGIFEVITSRRTNITAWGSHIEGAVMLVKMRGKKQLRTKLGHSLFAAVRHQMVINCMTGSKSPDLGVDWWLGDTPREDPSQQINRLHLLVIDLRVEVNKFMTILPQTPENIQKVASLLQRCHALEQEFLAWTATVPETWRFKTIAWVSDPLDGDLTTAEVYPGKVDVYDDLSIMTVWNMMRVSRLFLWGMIVRCTAWMVAPMDYRNTPEYEASVRICGEMVADTCASIPPCLGWTLEEDKKSRTAYSSGFACGDSQSKTLKGLGGYMSVFPLFTALCSDFTNDLQRKWIMGRLKFVSEKLGINQASTFAHYQLRLPSMIVKRDAINLASSNRPAFASGNSVNLPPSLPSIPLPAYGTSAALAFAHYTASNITPNGVYSSATSGNAGPPQYPVVDTPPYESALPGFSTNTIDPLRRVQMEMVHHTAQIEREKAEGERFR